jgi:hypothetical protein
MDTGEPKFFKYVWRYNALAIAGVASLLGLLALSMVYDLVRSMTRDREVSNVVAVEESPEAPSAVHEVFRLGSPASIAGTAFMQAPLFREQYQDRSYYSKGSTGNIANYMFLNTIANQSSWLMKDAGQLFLSNWTLTERIPSHSAGAGNAVAMVYQLVDKDTNADGVLTETDAATIATSGTDGTGFRKITEGLTTVHSVEQIANDRLLIFYERGADTISEIYSVPGLVKISEHKIQKIAAR